MTLVARTVNGVDVLVDDLATGDAQLAKLAAGAVGTEELIGSRDLGSDHALYVDNRPNNTPVSVNSAGLTNAAYAAGEVLGTGWSFSNMARVSGAGGKIRGITVLDKNDLLPSIQLWFASGSITFGSDNASPSISDSDAEKLLPPSGVGIVLTDLGGCKQGALADVAMQYWCDATTLFVYATTPLALGSGWATATDLRITITADLD